MATYSDISELELELDSEAELELELAELELELSLILCINCFNSQVSGHKRKSVYFI